LTAPRGVALLGATGSIGLNALDVIGRFPRRFKVTALCAGKNVRSLVDLADRFRPSVLCLAEPAPRSALKGLPPRTRVVCGEEGMHEAVFAKGTDIVLAAASGVTSIRPVIAAARAGKRIALANKELLVMAGKFLVEASRLGGGELLPVDSEHSAIFQSIEGHRREDIVRILLTASGGPFRTWTSARMRAATVADALGHPTWRMGAKITIDSATLMNKGLEMIEATWLFDMPPSRIDVVVHPQSVVHSMVEYRDGSVIAQLGPPDMRIPIGYALSWPGRLPLDVKGIAPHLSGDWGFGKPDLRRFPALGLAYAAAGRGGTAPAVLNAANEVAVEAFLAGRIRFTDIARAVGRAVDATRCGGGAGCLDDVLSADAAAREETERILSRIRIPGRVKTS
jgi:1-deoxy-D-xylulose-5-phosphate reductoisomerase